MKKYRAFTRLFLAIPVVFALLISGCSGGSGSNDGAVGPTITIGSSNVKLSMASASLQLTGSTTATATFLKIDGSPASGVQATFSTTLGTVTPSTVLTDARGTATVTLTAGSTSGQGQLTASAYVDNRLITSTALFSVSLPALHLGPITLTDNTPGNINYGSSQGVTVQVLGADGLPYTAQSVDVLFTSTMAANGKSTISSPVPTVNGVASTTYTAISGSGTDTITASIAGSSQTKTLYVVPLEAASITFVSASPTTIGLKGMGGLGVQETSRVTFKVLDTMGNPKANQAVTFGLNTTLGGLTLSAISGSTDNNGLVSTIVSSGVISTPVRVTATTIVGTLKLTTQSDQLVVSTGVPAQDGFSLSVGDMNPESYNIDGATTVVTARLSDHFHNPVPNGTAVYFTTSGGSITPSCLTIGGACTVNWTSQNPRPSTSSGALRNGRAVVLAYAVGEEAFIDKNGNGLADDGEFTDDTEAYRDDNENGTRDANEPYIDFNGNTAFNTGDGKYNGVFQGTAYIGQPISKDVFGNHSIVMSASAAEITTSVGSIAAPTSFTITVRDQNGNTMPSGTTIKTTAPFGKLTGSTNYIVPQNIGFGQTLTLRIDATDSPKEQSGTIVIEVTSPSGLVTTALIPISGSF